MKILSVFIALLLIHGCSYYDTEKKDKSDYLEKPGEKISKVVFESGNFIQFDEDGGKYFNLNNCVAGMTQDKNFTMIPINDISKVLTSWGYLSLGEDLYADTAVIRQVLLKDNKLYTFRKWTGGGRYFKGSKIIIAGFDTSSRFYKIGIDSVSYLDIFRFNQAKSCIADFGLALVAGAAVVLIVAATKESCPFIYSYDGNRYVFDKEPLGGATASILQRTELSKLKYLRQSKGKYKLLVTNEVEETQNIDKLKLTYVDHNKGESIFPDIHNNLYSIKNEILPVSASDENGKDLMPFFKSDDGIFWKSKMPANTGEIKDKTRNEIFLSFIKPKSSDKCNLIINAGTTLWGSNMIKEMLLLYGSNIDNYYLSINKGGEEYNSMMNFLQKEELFQLKLYAKINGEWKYKTTINGGGPFKSETRAYPIDISDINGDTIMFKVDPPMGFWTFDYAAVDFSPASPAESYTLDVSKAVDNNSENIESLLTKEDKNYYSMHDNGNYFYAEFDAPLMPEGKERTIFANTSGWYQIHLPKTGTTNITQLLKFVTEPGSIVKYSNNKFIEWENRNKLSYQTK